jgi:cobalt transporter subunit CbtA
VIRRLFLSGIAAGVLAGLIISAIHQVTTVPIILHAETFEDSAKQANRAVTPALTPAGFRFLGTSGGAASRAIPVHGGQEEAAGGAWAPEDGIERTVFTAMTTVLAGVGFALLLVAGMTLRGERVEFRRGVLWGAAGFVAFTLAPTLGLPPEIPGAAAADLVARQVWWIAAAATACGGLWLLVFIAGAVWKAVGVALLAAPHLIGAPHPLEISAGGAPAELAAQFAAASIATSAVFWVLLGGFAGFFFGRSEPSA